MRQQPVVEDAPMPSPYSLLGPRQLTLLCGLFLLLPPGQALAYDARLRPQFERLDSHTRLEEVCDTEVTLRINRDKPELQVDKVVAYTFKQPVEQSDRLAAEGAAFRSRGKWFHLRYKCQTGPRHLDVHDLSYQIGGEIGKALWRRYYLYD